LDEVETFIEIQPKWVRAVQERELEWRGGTPTRKVKVRLVAATNRDLERVIANTEFRTESFLSPWGNRPNFQEAKGNE